jgi:hypothetical protein
VIAAASPAGPPPTTKTSVSVGNVWLNSVNASPFQKQ